MSSPRHIAARQPLRTGAILLCGMTKVQVTFDLTRAVTEADMNAISDAYSVYGIQSIRLTPALDSITVVFDASRMSEAGVENALIRSGIPLKRKDIPVGPTA